MVKRGGDNRTLERDETSVKVWGDNRPGSLCRDNSVTSVKFGTNLISGCYIKLSASQLHNCSLLLQQIHQIQQSLINSPEFVAKTGDLNFTRAPDDFVPVIFENSTKKSQMATETPFLSACSVPAKIKLTFLTITIDGKYFIACYATKHSSFVAEGAAVRKINGLKITPVYQSWVWRCKTNLFNGDCDKSDSLQSFFLSTQVEFLEIPNIWHHQNTSRFWLKQVNMIFLHTKISTMFSRILFGARETSVGRIYCLRLKD